MLRRLACLSLLLLGACALRPRYDELTTRFVAQGDSPNEVLVQVVDRDDMPVPGARIELGDRAKFKATTDANGVFKLPLEKRFVDENPLVVVVLPPGVRGYKLQAPQVQTQQSPGLMDAPPAADGDAADGGVTTM